MTFLAFILLIWRRKRRGKRRSVYQLEAFNTDRPGLVVVRGVGTRGQGAREVKAGMGEKNERQSLLAQPETQPDASPSKAGELIDGH